MSHYTLMLQYVFSKNRNTLINNHGINMETRKFTMVQVTCNPLPIIPIISFLRSRIQSRMMYLLVISLQSLLIWTISSGFSTFMTDTFDESKSVTLQIILQFGFVSCFLMIRFMFCISGRNITEMTLCSSHCVISGDT